jgi:MFS family permease
MLRGSLLEVQIADQKSISKSDNLDLTFKQLVPVLLIAGTGFLVDVYDIVLFSVLRVPSLTGIGISQVQTLPVGVFLLNAQLIGMILGGFIWGIWGDKRGRKTALFGSIFLYSLATLLNGFVHSIPEYAMLRFVAGIGLAGEVGAAITIAAEATPAKYRAYGMACVRGMGALGGILACIIGDWLDWRTAYITAGMAGFILLFARISMKESRVFTKILEKETIKRGSIKLFLHKGRFLRLVRCILVTVPFWFAFGILVSFAPEISGSGKNNIVTVATVALYYSIGVLFGEIFSGALSQILRSRKLAIIVFMCISIVLLTILFISPRQYYALLFLPLGLFIAYNVVVNTTTAEQFGTNLRATASTLAPNFVRASAIPITLLFGWLATIYGAMAGAMIAGAVCFIGAFISLYFMEETFAKDLNFVEY